MGSFCSWLGSSSVSEQLAGRQRILCLTFLSLFTLLSVGYLRVSIDLELLRGMGIAFPLWESNLNESSRKRDTTLL